MLRSMLKSKIHRATVTAADINYEGSLSLDPVLIKAADLRPYEQIMVYNVTNGERFETYVIEGPRDSGCVQLNGGAARKGLVGDHIIIASYVLCSEEEIDSGKSIVVLMNEDNTIKKRSEVPW